MVSTVQATNDAVTHHIAEQGQLLAAKLKRGLAAHRMLEHELEPVDRRVVLRKTLGARLQARSGRSEWKIAAIKWRKDKPPPVPCLL